MKIRSHFIFLFFLLILTVCDFIVSKRFSRVDKGIQEEEERCNGGGSNDSDADVPLHIYSPVSVIFRDSLINAAFSNMKYTSE